MTIAGLITAARAARFDGPLGSLLARAARYLPKRLLRRIGGEAAADPANSVAFTIAVIALGAKMAKADGTVTRDEVAAFREVFQVHPSEAEHLRLVFDIARRSTAGYQSYARQVGRLFAGRPAILEDLMAGLFHIALADGLLCASEEAYLRDVANLLGFDSAAYNRIRSGFVDQPDGGEDPHTVLGVAADATNAEIRAAHRQLIRVNHPDAQIARGGTPDRIALANARMARINAARDRLLRRRSRLPEARQA
ncbi:MAG: TerB family tellurite resistance protein [Alphaproteobacteria bacterium]|nr:TerB family tellurite resistance protein [Alphaproteobacteria bacterium]